MPITDQVVTAPCTDPIQSSFPTFEAKPTQLAIKRVDRASRKTPEQLIAIYQVLGSVKLQFEPELGTT